MANEIYTSLRAKGIGPIFNEYFKTNAVVLAKGVKEDYIQILTKSYTPYRDIAMLSAKMGNIDIIHFWCDNDSFGNDKYENIWNNGKLIKSYVYPFNFDKDDYDEKVEVPVTDEFNVYLEDLNKFLEINDLEVQEYKDQNGKYLQFYFRTTNQYKEFENITDCKETIKRELCEKYEKEGILFDEEDFEETYFSQIVGKFYEDGSCNIFFEANHEDLKQEKIYNLKNYLNPEHFQMFWDLVRDTIEWQEFMEKQNDIER